MSLPDSLKAAGASVLSVASEFGDALKADRAGQPKAEGVVDNLKSVAGSVTRAAKEAAGSEAFAAAKQDVTKVLGEAKDEIQARVGEKNAGTAAEAGPNVVDGEVVEDDK